jgi:broad specificity phosphatase PhoE
MSMQRVKHRTFVPISIEQYIQLHVRRNPDEKAAELRARLRECVAAVLRGERCQCGEPIWVIGSAVAGHACFTCITGEATPSDDYEIDEVLGASLP